VCNFAPSKVCICKLCSKRKGVLFCTPCKVCKKHGLRCVICSPEIQGKIHTIWCVKIHTFLKNVWCKVCEFGDKQETQKKTHLKACFFTHLYLANTHLEVCKNTHLFRKIHTLTCVEKHDLRCVNLATEGVLKIHTLFFRVWAFVRSDFPSV
jgi:hypothetical protein